MPSTHAITLGSTGPGAFAPRENELTPGLGMRSGAGWSFRIGGCFVLASIALCGAADLQSRGKLSFSRDTLYECGYFSRTFTDEVYLINRGNEPISIDSLAVALDAGHPTLSFAFNIVVMENGMRKRERVFYWNDGKTGWISWKMVVPARDSAQIYFASLDRCPKCVGKPPPSTGSLDARIPISFRSRSGDTATLLVRGWYTRQ
jgi:hypothetical protein